MTKRPIILTFVAYYLPGYKSGGPARTIANMVDQLSDDFDFRIITTDRDSHDVQAYQGVTSNEWNEVGKAKVFYISPNNIKFEVFTKLLRETSHDVVYLNSFFRTSFSFMPLIIRYSSFRTNQPLVIAPRGEFSRGALALKSWKKRIFIGAAKTLGLYRNLVWQASSEYEVADIRRIMGAVAPNIFIAPDVPALQIDKDVAIAHKIGKPGDPLRVCFLSRIDPKKNLDYALRVITKVRCPVEFNIYGVISDELHWEKCLNLIKQVPANVSVKYCGGLDHAFVSQELSKHDLFFFPTLGENYGHVIYEALSSGLPVLISDQTPWRNLEIHGVGWDFPLENPELFQQQIEAYARLSAETRLKKRKNVKGYSKLIATDKGVLNANRQLFAALVK